VSDPVRRVGCRRWFPGGRNRQRHGWLITGHSFRYARCVCVDRGALIAALQRPSSSLGSRSAPSIASFDVIIHRLSSVSCWAYHWRWAYRLEQRRRSDTRHREAIPMETDHDRAHLALRTSYHQIPFRAKLHYTGTGYTNIGYGHHQRQAHNNSTTNLPHRNARAQHVKMLGCGKFLSVGGVRSRCPRSGVWLLLCFYCCSHAIDRQASTLLSFSFAVHF